MKIKKRIIFITGASRGIGKAIAVEFKKQPENYIIGTYTGKSKIDSSICDEWFMADFKNDHEIFECRNFIKKKKPNVLINNAGYNINNSFEKINESDFLNIQKVNVFAPFLFSQASIKNMKKNKWGRIINIASIWSKVSKSGRAAYSASKFALDGLTLSLATEYAEHNILANCISPGFINTDLTKKTLSKNDLKTVLKNIPIKRLGKVEEIAKFIIWLCSDENTFISGQNIAIDGGFSRA